MYMIYVRSIYTGQIYEMEYLPQYDGYELATKEEYDRQREEYGLA